MSINERFDNFYYTMCNETGGIDGLMHTFFSFLYRKTDFFIEMEPGDKMGFPPGYQEKMLIKTFKMYQNEYYKKHPKKSPEAFKQKLEK